MENRFCSSVLKGRITDEAVGSVVHYSGPLPSSLLCSPNGICLGFPRLAFWETRCNSKNDLKEICSLLLMVEGFCLQHLFLPPFLGSMKRTDKHPNCCRVLSNWKSRIKWAMPLEKTGTQRSLTSSSEEKNLQ